MQATHLIRLCLAHSAQVTQVLEEEWSYIPVGGPLPLGWQTATAFGAAANLVHPATGYSIARSLREAPALARQMAAVLRRRLPVRETAAAVWAALWPPEKQRQVGDWWPPLRGELCHDRLCMISCTPEGSLYDDSGQAPVEDKSLSS